MISSAHRRTHVTASVEEFLLMLMSAGAWLLPLPFCKDSKHHSGHGSHPVLLAPAFNMLVFSLQLSTCCTGVTSSRQGSSSAASCCCSSPWPSSALSASWLIWLLPASRPPLASESTNRSYRLCRRRTRATPSSECFEVMARGHLPCKGSIPSGNSSFFTCCFYNG